ncbi:phosphonate metabolism protein/1,5-bisphosphokinase (PRPP-forming) PhnN [Rhizobium sp. FKY42]|uniref:phosphonate metabolism protein/1,5-bisphosphokinase (PRPP-forming) PhnN n=1 Tax=Rhizobium sp. FKY42 TaxID=2562310 RepID=UPI0010C00FB3|nr:phosphonate metabolism protein/1,5-bisphosphokinase (PRPP-forming) PhnN [Rhizobium sp. FKY42]
MVSSGANTDGTLLAVVGPSGVGKDSLINALRTRLHADASVHFVRRVITRPADAGGEDHDAVTVSEFERLVANGAFAVHWQAHGLSYGILRSAAEAYNAGKTVVVNGSRAALPLFSGCFCNTIVVNITADPEVIAQRLASRGREDAEQIAQRLKRGADLCVPCQLPVHTIDNSRDLEAAVEEFLKLVQRLNVRRVKTA